MAIKVKLRQKVISGNRISLYLDFYPAVPHPKTGELSRREFLGFYIFAKPKTSIEKQHNKETLELAEQIWQKRTNSINKPEIYSGYEKEQLKIKELGESSFIEYFNKLVDKRKASNHDNWISAYNYLKTYTNGNLNFSELNEKFCNDFKEYLLTTSSIRSKDTKLSQNSAVSYFNKFKASLKQAFKDGYINVDLNSRIDPIKSEEVLKNTLTLEELNILAKTDFKNTLLKRVTLFSALTGMAFAEMKKLVWGEIEVSESFGIRIPHIRKKTNHPVYLNISKQAYYLLGPRKNPNDEVFEGLNNNDRYTDFHLFLAKAGIQKDMTFHDLRHTYGTIQSDLGTDPFVLQKQYNHATIKQTQAYAHVSDKRKQEAAERIKLDDFEI